MNLTKAQIVDLLVAADAELTDLKVAQAKADGELDWASLPNRTKAQMVELLRARFAKQDLLTRRRLRAQAASQFRLMTGRSYEDEMSALQEQMAELERQLETARGRIRALEGTDVAAHASQGL